MTTARARTAAGSGPQPRTPSPRGPQRPAWRPATRRPGPAPTGAACASRGSWRGGTRGGELLLKGIAKADQWGKYAEAIHRHEQAFGRPAPNPTEPGHKGNRRLSARFVEWMQGLPEGWVTDTPGITRNEALKALGNGVVPQQALAALRLTEAHP